VAAKGARQGRDGLPALLCVTPKGRRARGAARSFVPQPRTASQIGPVWGMWPMPGGTFRTLSDGLEPHGRLGR
jgi:hypothetical protein